MVGVRRKRERKEANGRYSSPLVVKMMQAQMYL